MPSAPVPTAYVLLVCTAAFAMFPFLEFQLEPDCCFDRNAGRFESNYNRLSRTELPVALHSLNKFISSGSFRFRRGCREGLQIFILYIFIPVDVPSQVIPPARDMF